MVRTTEMIILKNSCEPLFTANNSLRRLVLRLRHAFLNHIRLGGWGDGPIERPHQLKLNLLHSRFWCRHATRFEERYCGHRKATRVKIAPRLSRLGWFSRALAFRSLYYPWGKMGTTRSLIPRQDVCDESSRVPISGRHKRQQLSPCTLMLDHTSLPISQLSPCGLPAITGTPI